jgi:hypothetical protein
MQISAGRSDPAGADRPCRGRISGRALPR